MPIPFLPLSLSLTWRGVPSLCLPQPARLAGTYGGGVCPANYYCPTNSYFPTPCPANTASPKSSDDIFDCKVWPLLLDRTDSALPG